MKRRRNPVTDQESALFREAMRGVQPLTDAPAEATPVVAQKTRPKPAVKTAPAAITPGKPAKADGSGVQARTLQRLRRRRLRPEATLDLHGFTRHEAHLEVDRFLRRAHAAGRRCVLIIHGIGRGSESHGVLRQALPGWLAAHPEVLSSAPAQPADGGAGASYILLRRAAPPR
jgi:DNA-nicking Smr family endonuclease